MTATIWDACAWCGHSREWHAGGKDCLCGCWGYER